MQSDASESRNVRKRKAEKEDAERVNAAALAEAFEVVDGKRIVGREGYPAKLTARAILVKDATIYGQEFYIHRQYMARMDYYPDPFGDIYELGFELYCGNVALGRIIAIRDTEVGFELDTSEVTVTLRWGARKRPEKTRVGSGRGVESTEGGVRPCRAQEACR